MNQPVLPSSSHEEHMLGHGFYNKHSYEQAKANTCGLPLIIEAINQIDLQQTGSDFPIADYGSAQGQNSLLPMKTGSPLLLIQIFRCLSIILKNSRCPTFILNALSTTVPRRHSLKRTLVFSKRRSAVSVRKPKRQAHV